MSSEKRQRRNESTGGHEQQRVGETAMVFDRQERIGRAANQHVGIGKESGRRADDQRPPSDTAARGNPRHRGARQDVSEGIQITLPIPLCSLGSQTQVLQNLAQTLLSASSRGTSDLNADKSVNRVGVRGRVAPQPRVYSQGRLEVIAEGGREKIVCVTPIRREKTTMFDIRLFRLQLPLCILMAASLSMISCASVPGVAFEVKGAPPHHIVMIDTNGRLVDPTGDNDCLSRKNPSAWKAVLDQNLTDAGFSAREKWSWTPCVGQFLGFSHITLSEPDAYLDDLIDEIHRHFEKRRSATRKIAIIVHGGLADNRSNIEMARDLAAQMRNDPDAPYPIFVNWQSNLYSNLWAHLVRVRQGRSKGFKHWFIAIPYLAGDLAKGIGRAPATWFYHYSNEIERLRRAIFDEQTSADAIYCALRAEYEACTNQTDCKVFPISKGPFRHTRTEGAKSTAKNSFTNLVPIRFYAPLVRQAAGNRLYGWLPVKLLVAPLLDGLGTSAWDTMLRHVKVGFHNDGVDGREPDADPSPATRRVWQEPQGYGGIARFMRRLQAEIEKTSCKPGAVEKPAHCFEWQLDLIGHSMGAIMANEMLREFPDAPVFDNIVYMAAAAPLRDYEMTVLPYLEQHRDTKMYHLMLHDFAEIREESALGIPPSGSLLVWIDNFLSKPATVRDRTAGRFVNLMRVLPATPRDLRHRIHVKTFGVGAELRREQPQEHGEFNNFIGQPSPKEQQQTPVARDAQLKFWEKTFWTPEEKDGDDDPKTRKLICPPPMEK